VSGETGYYSYLTGRTARFIAHQRARGMSASALARLPQVSEWDETFRLRPVLAKRPPFRPTAGMKSELSEAAKEQLRAAKCRELPFQIKWSGKADDRTTARAKAIINEVASALNLEGYQLTATGNGRRFSFARQIAMYMVMQYAKPSTESAAELFGLRDGKTIRYALGRISLMLEAGNRDVLLAHDLAKAAIVHRWPEYAE